jgi:hypothetical protein
VLNDYVEYSEPNELIMGFEQDDSIGDQDDFVIDPELEFVNDPLYKDLWRCCPRPL